MADTVERPLVCRGEPPTPPDKAAALVRARARRDEGRIRRSTRNRALVLGLSTLGHPAKQIAEELGLALSTVRDIQFQLRSEKKLDTVLAQLEHRGIPAAVEGIIEAAENRERWAVEGLLKGRGYLASGSAGAGQLQTGPPPALFVNVMLAPGVPQDDPRLKPIPGNIVGVPRTLADKVDDEAEKA